LAAGQAVLDLRHLDARASNRTFDVAVGVGQVRIVARRSLPLTVDAHVHVGAVTATDGPVASGVGVDRILRLGGAGTPFAVDVQLADGNVRIEQR
jgi:hypothetical protein